MSTTNHSILKEINSEYSLEVLMLKLKLQYFGHLMERVNSLEKMLMLGKAKGRKRRGRQGRRWLDGIASSASLSKLQEVMKDREPCPATVHGVAKSWTQLNRNPALLQSMGWQRAGHDWTPTTAKQAWGRELSLLEGSDYRQSRPHEIQSGWGNKGRRKRMGNETWWVRDWR